MVVNKSCVAACLESVRMAVESVSGSAWNHCPDVRGMGVRVSVESAADQDYLITQAIADFLATHPKLNLDGILFPSVQAPEDSAPGQNVVLFHKASGVARAGKDDALEHVELWESDGNDGRFAPEIFDAKPQRQNAVFSRGQLSSRATTLRLDRSRIAVHKINAVSFSYETNPVRHVSWEENRDVYGRR